MTTTRKTNSKKIAENWRTPGSAVELGPADQLAHGIVTERPDLMPSVERIMSAELDADGRLRALTLFQTALHTPGDVHRDPRVAIAQCQSDASADANPT